MKNLKIGFVLYDEGYSLAEMMGNEILNIRVYMCVCLVIQSLTKNSN